MRELGVLEARTQFSSLLDDVERGEEVLITRHGRVIARVVGVNAPSLKPGPEIAERIRARREAAAARYLAHDVDTEPFDAVAELRAFREGER